jgi:hypothetical protein
MEQTLKFLLAWGLAYLFYMLLASVILWNFTLNPGDLNVTGRVFLVIWMLAAVKGAAEASEEW